MRRRTDDRTSDVIVGAVLLAIAVVVVFVAFTKFNPFDHPFVLKAAFRTSNDIGKGSPVRIAGVNVGKVTKIEGGNEQGEGAIVTMELDDKGLPIHEDARLKIRSRIFLEGNYFVDLRPGSPSAKVVEEGHTIPAPQTAAPVQLGQVLEALQSDTRQDLQITLQEFGRALTSEDYAGAKGFNASIPYWEPAYKDSAIASDATRGLLERDLSGYVRSGGLVASALTRNRTALRGLVSDFATTAGALAQEQAGLRASIAELPRFLRQGFTTLGVLNEAFPPVRAFIPDARAAVRSEGPALEAQLPFIRQGRGLMSEPELRGLVADLRPTVPSLVRLSEGGVPLQKQLRLLGSCQTNVITPTLKSTLPDPHFPSQGPVYQEAVKWLPGIAGESRSYDANAQFVKTLAATANYAYPIQNGRFYMTQVPLQGVNPPKAPQPPYRPGTPCETQEPPNLASTPQAPPAGFQIATPTLPAAGPSARAMATAEAEQAALDSQDEGATAARAAGDEPATVPATAAVDEKLLTPSKRVDLALARALVELREQIRREGQSDVLGVRAQPVRRSELHVPSILSGSGSG